MTVESLPMWERGLKPSDTLTSSQSTQVAPHVGAWIETLIADNCKSGKMSLPMWERGLKPSPLHQVVTHHPGRSPCGSVD